MTRLLVGAAIVALLATGCGTAEKEPTLAEAAATTVEAGSSRVSVTGTALDGNERIDISCSGEAAYETERLRIACDYGSRVGMEIVGIGTDVYLRGDVFGFGASDDKWVKVTDGEAFGNELSPHGLLELLRGASRSTERVAAEQIRGVETVRHRLVVDCGEAELFDCEGETTPVDVWVDDDGLVRRIAFEDGDSPFVVEFFDFGVDVDIEAPRADQVVDLDEWIEPKACRPAAGAPLTGIDVAGAFHSAGFVAEQHDTCVSGVVAQVFAVPEQDGRVVQCAVYPSVEAARSRSTPSGAVREIANVSCAGSGEFPSSAATAFSALERQARN